MFKKSLIMLRTIFLPVLLISISFSVQAQTEELDAFWAEASRSVKEGDFEAYARTFHGDAVLVNGMTGTSFPIAEALAGWKSGFEQTANGEMTASVEFRFSERYLGETTAHETGIFKYSSQTKYGEPRTVYIHFEALSVKKGGTWRTVMEYQKSMATVEDWDALG
jgi:ketosteroid isomerase-like protein